MYIKIDWPEYQSYMDEDWWDKEVFMSETPGGHPVAFIPEARMDPEIAEDDYVVNRLEIYEQPVVVSADEVRSPEEAVEIVKEGGGHIISHMLSFQRDYTGSRVYWDVEHGDDRIFVQVS